MGNQLDKKTTNCCKGIAAVIIMLHHISFKVSNLPIYIKPIWYIAFPVVGFFFFMSGYGLTCGLMKKKNYLQGFLSKRVLNVVIPYVIVVFGWIGLEISRGQRLEKAFAEAFTIHYIQPLWFIWVIIVTYIVFYMVFKCASSVQVGVSWFVGITIVYIFISAFVNRRDEMYASIIGMPLGVLWAMYEKRIDLYFEVNFCKKEFISIVVFMSLFITRLVLSIVGIDNRLFQTVFRNIITVMFLVSLIGILKRVKLSRKLLMWLGAISYEIYIVHPFILYDFEKKMEDGQLVNNFEVIVGTIGLTLLLSCILKVVQDYIIRNVRK